MYHSIYPDPRAGKGLRLQRKHRVRNTDIDQLDQKEDIITLKIHPHCRNQTEKEVRRRCQNRKNQQSSVLKDCNAQENSIS
jgi:hypothetical protein